MNFKETKAIYLQIADLLCDEILAGQHADGERIPSVREYAAKVEVNANTCARAYEWLQGKEVIYTKRGLGYFVSPGAREAITAARKAEFLGQTLPQLAKQMHELGITPEQLMEQLRKTPPQPSP